MWPALLFIAVMEGFDYIREQETKREIEELFRAHFLDTNGQVNTRRGQVEASHWVLVLKGIVDGRHCLHARDTDETGRSSRTVREYYYNPQTRELSNATLRQAFGWKANLKH